MPKGSKPYPYNRTPKTGGMPPMGQPKPKKAPGPRSSPGSGRRVPASKSLVPSGPRVNPNSLRGGSVVVSGARNSTGRAVVAAAGRNVAAYAGRGAAVGRAGGIAGAVAGAAIGAMSSAVVEIAKARGPLFGGKDRGRGAPMNKGPSTRRAGRAAPAVTQVSDSPTVVTGSSYKPVQTKGGEYRKYKKNSAEAASFRKAFSAAKGKNFKWQGREYSGNRKP